MPRDTNWPRSSSTSPRTPASGRTCSRPNVGKPLAYVLATPERADDRHNTLRVAFGNEASDRDIEVADYRRRFVEAMEDDLATPQALSVLFNLARAINRARDGGHEVADAQAELRETVDDLAFGDDPFDVDAVGRHDQSAHSPQSELVQGLGDRCVRGRSGHRRTLHREDRGHSHDLTSGCSGPFPAPWPAVCVQSMHPTAPPVTEVLVQG